MSDSSPLSFEPIRDGEWDVVVIGAGPAGSLAAHQLARQGFRTLVVEAGRFPRAKVCGGCLNQRGVAALRSVGLAHLVDANHTESVQYLHLIAGPRRARIALPETRVVDRANFDQALAQAAAEQGALLIEGAHAVVEQRLNNCRRQVTIACDDDRITISAPVVICADGLSRLSLKRLTTFNSFVRPGSRIGVGATIPQVNGVASNEIAMIVSSQGYVGLARNQPNRWSIAAALDASALAETTVDELIRQILVEAGFVSSTPWQPLNWRGTPRLTSYPGHVAAERLFVIGDSGGYVEPFSGEGMATAFETALAVVPLATAAIREWRPSLAAEWERCHRRLVVDRQAPCKQLAWIVRHRWATALAITVCRSQPWIAQRFIARIGEHPFPLNQQSSHSI